MKKMKLLQALEDLLAEPGHFSVLFPSFSFLWNHRVKVLQGEGGVEEKEREIRKERVKERQVERVNKGREGGKMKGRKGGRDEGRRQEEGERKGRKGRTERETGRREGGRERQKGGRGEKEEECTQA